MSNELVSVEQKQVPFNDEVITAVRVPDGTVYVPIRPICERIGVAWSAQRLRINRDPVLSKHFVIVTITKSGRGNPNQMCLPLDYLNGWLFGINAGRVKAEIRDRLIAYQEECYKVLADAFGRNMVTAKPDDLLMTSDSPAALAYRNALQMANLARQQFYLEQRIESAENSITQMNARVDAIEAELGNDARFVTMSQAAEISEGVKLIAGELGKATGRNEYQGVYMELYRRFGITSYKKLPSAKYDEAMNFLRQWFSSATGEDDVPF